MIIRMEYLAWLELKTCWPIGEILFVIALIFWPIERCLNRLMVIAITMFYLGGETK